VKNMLLDTGKLRLELEAEAQHDKAEEPCRHKRSRQIVKHLSNDRHVNIKLASF